MGRPRASRPGAAPAGAPRPGSGDARWSAGWASAAGLSSNEPRLCGRGRAATGQPARQLRLAGTPIVSGPRPLLSWLPPPRSAPSWTRLPGCSGWPRPRPGPRPPGPAAALAINSAGSSTGRTGRSGWSRSLRCWPPCSARTTPLTAPHRTACCSGEPARAAQRIGLRPRLAIRPCSRPRARASAVAGHVCPAGFVV